MREELKSQKRQSGAIRDQQLREATTALRRRGEWSPGPAGPGELGHHRDLKQRGKGETLWPLSSSSCSHIHPEHLVSREPGRQRPPGAAPLRCRAGQRVMWMGGQRTHGQHDPLPRGKQSPSPLPIQHSKPLPHFCLKEAGQDPCPLLSSPPSASCFPWSTGVLVGSNPLPLSYFEPVYSELIITP